MSVGVRPLFFPYSGISSRLQILLQLLLIWTLGYIHTEELASKETPHFSTYERGYTAHEKAHREGALGRCNRGVAGIRGPFANTPGVEHNTNASSGTAQGMSQYSE